MRKPRIRYDLILFALLMAFIFLPLIQEHTGLIIVKPLIGAFEPTPKPELTFDSYRTNAYQTQIEKYASENFGLREPIIRIYNQYLWTAFNKTYCHFIVPGKDGYLFYALAVNEYFGTELPKHYKSNEDAMKDIDRLRHILNADYVVFYSAGHQWWEATYGFAKDALLQLCVSDSLFEATVTNMAKQMRNYEGYSDMTEEEVRNNMAYMLRNDPELIPGLEGEEMPTIRNTKRIEQALFANRIKADKDWLSSIQMYATQKAISLDDALKEEAKRMDQGESLIRDEVVFDTATFIQMKKLEIMEKWRHNPEMVNMIQQKAKERNISFEVMLEKDALWVINQQIEKGELFQ